MIIMFFVLWFFFAWILNSNPMMLLVSTPLILIISVSVYYLLLFEKEEGNIYEGWFTMTDFISFMKSVVNLLWGLDWLLGMFFWVSFSSVVLIFWACLFLSCCFVLNFLYMSGLIFLLCGAGIFAWIYSYLSELIGLVW